MTAAPTIAPADKDSVSRAARALAAGELVAFPTETVYGLGADATNERAVAKIFAAKGRPRFNPLIVHVPDLAAARSIAEFNSRAEAVAKAFWPGPLSVVLPRRSGSGLSLLVSAGLDTVAIRIPGDDLARELLTAAGRPVAAPSANASGEVSPTAARHVAQSLPGPDDGGPGLILDAGPCGVGLESTVIDLSGGQPAILRPGGVTAEDLRVQLGALPMAGVDDAAPKSPGMLSRHYAPKTPLRMDATARQPDEALLGFGPDYADATVNLSPSANLTEAAANLFAMLRDLDGQAHTAIAVAPVPDHGLGAAINDRLRRAACGR